MRSLHNQSLNRKHGDPVSFKKQEEGLLKTIHEVNGYIRQQNQSLHTFSPNCATDICHHNEKTYKTKRQLSIRSVS